MSATESLPADKAARDAAKIAADAADAKSHAAELAQLEQATATEYREHAARLEARAAAHVARERELANSHAVDVFQSPLRSALIEWRKTQSRADVNRAMAAIREFEARIQSELGCSLRPVTAALAFAAGMVDKKPELVAAFAEPDFFAGSWGFIGVGAKLAEASARFQRASLAENTVAAEDALFDIERAIHAQLEGRTIAKPTAEQVATWRAQLESGRDADFDQRREAIKPTYVPVPSHLASLTEADESEADQPDDERDAAFDAETAALTRAVPKRRDEGTPPDTAHFDRLAAEQLAPRAVQQRT